MRNGHQSVTLVAYLSKIDSQWRGVDHDAHKFIKGLKGEAVKGLREY